MTPTPNSQLPTPAGPAGLPAKLRAARDAAGLRAIDVARELGVSLQTVYRWEYGIHAPSVARLSKLKALYGVEGADWI